jgi:hypothetical protein
MVIFNFKNEIIYNQISQILKLGVKMTDSDNSKLFKRVKAKLKFWLLSSNSQFGPDMGDYISLDRIASTASFRKEDPYTIKDIIHLIVKLEPENFELNETEDAIRVPNNNPKFISEKLLG